MLQRLPTSGRITRLPSASLNRVIEDYAPRGGARQPGRAGVVQAASGFGSTPFVVVDVENDSGGDLVEYGIAGIDQPSYTPPTIGGSNEADDAVLQAPVVRVETATEADHAGKFVITLGPIGDGERGQAVIMGLTWCRVDLQAESDTTAGVKDGEAEMLEGGKPGPTIVWKPSGTGEKWCLVLLGGGGGGGSSVVGTISRLPNTGLEPQLPAAERVAFSDLPAAVKTALQDATSFTIASDDVIVRCPKRPAIKYTIVDIDDDEDGGSNYIAGEGDDPRYLVPSPSGVDYDIDVWNMVFEEIGIDKPLQSKATGGVQFIDVEPCGP